MKAFAWTSFCFVEKSPLFPFYLTQAQYVSISALDNSQ